MDQLKYPCVCAEHSHAIPKRATSGGPWLCYSWRCVRSRRTEGNMDLYSKLLPEVDSSRHLIALLARGGSLDAKRHVHGCFKTRLVICAAF